MRKRTNNHSRHTNGDLFKTQDNSRYRRPVNNNFRFSSSWIGCPLRLTGAFPLSSTIVTPVSVGSGPFRFNINVSGAPVGLVTIRVKRDATGVLSAKEIKAQYIETNKMFAKHITADILKAERVNAIVISIGRAFSVTRATSRKKWLGFLIE
jgi:hypothetical protein